MKRKFIAVLSAFLITLASSAQEGDFIRYRVSKGETVSKIARENGISVTEIFKHNPEAKQGINEGAFLLLPNPNAQKKVTVATSNTTELPAQRVKFEGEKTHLVQPKETLYSITRKYDVSVQDLYRWNPTLEAEGLKADSLIVVGIGQGKKGQQQPTTVQTNQPSEENPLDVTAIDNSRHRIKSRLSASSPDTIKDINNIYYKFIDVEPQATLYSLAVLYNTSIQRLTELNPELKDGLKSGQKLKVPAYGFANKEETVTIKAPVVQKEGGNNYVEVKVSQGETIYSISKKYDVDFVKLLEMNPELKNGLRSGMIIKVPTTGETVRLPKEEEATMPVASVVLDTNFKNLEYTVDKQKRREIVMLLPFNLAKGSESLKQRVEKDAFLNMTLDFYAGVQMALEEVEEKGLPLTVKVYDSNETKNSSDVVAILKKENFSNTDAIIGPFFQANVDQATANLPNKEVVLVSPMSNERLKASSQLVQTMPSPDMLKATLLQYLIKQPNTKVTVIVDPKRTSTKQFMQNQFPSIKVISTTEIKDVDKTLISNTNNVFILDSGSIASGSELVRKLKAKTGSFEVQIASFDRGTIFNSDEIAIQDLIDLKYTYPSVTRETANSLEESEFQKQYIAKYNAMPNRFVMRGYDVTKDVILRIFQREGALSSIKYPTEEIENKFIYRQQPNGVIINSGVYLLQYTDDLSVKILN